MSFRSIRPIRPLTVALAVLVAACSESGPTEGAADAAAVLAAEVARIDRTASSGEATVAADAATFLLLDGEAIEKETAPTRFSDRDINEDIKGRSQRSVLRWFAANVGRTIDIRGGGVGDEGFHAPTRIPASWMTAGTAGGGVRNLLAAAPGLGGRDNDDLLDKVPAVRPLRATGLTMLRGRAVCALVIAGDIGTNYAPQYASLKGDALGIVAFDIVETRTNTAESSTSLPFVTIRVRDAQTTCGGPLALFANAPAPRSSSEPNDIRVPAATLAPVFRAAP
jgi:hypothetical protein